MRDAEECERGERVNNVNMGRRKMERVQILERDARNIPAFNSYPSLFFSRNPYLHKIFHLQHRKRRREELVMSVLRMVMERITFGREKDKYKHCREVTFQDRDADH